MTSLARTAMLLLMAAAATTATVASAAGSIAACNPEPAGQVYLSPRYSYEVLGPGRLPFYTAPDLKCKHPSLFVVPGDSLSAHNVFGNQREWTSVAYFTTNGDTVSGWVQTGRLMFVGASGFDMTPDQIKGYETKAAAALAAARMAGTLAKPTPRR